MFRYLFALLAVTGFVSEVSAQRVGLPLSPGVRPASPIGPGTQFLPQPTPRFNPAFGSHMGQTNRFGHQVTAAPTFFRSTYYGGYGGYGRGYGFGYGLGYGYSNGYYPDYGYSSPLVIEVGPPPQPEPTVVLVNEFPATLTVQFPAAAEVWLNGTEGKGEAAEERVLTSHVLKPGEQFAFDVKGRWTVGGKTYESARTVTLGSGDRSRLFVVSGTEVK